MSFAIDPSAQELLLNWVNNVGKLPEYSALRAMITEVCNKRFASVEEEIEVVEKLKTDVKDLKMLQLGPVTLEDTLNNVVKHLGVVAKRLKSIPEAPHGAISKETSKESNRLPSPLKESERKVEEPLPSKFMQLLHLFEQNPESKSYLEALSPETKQLIEGLSSEGFYYLKDMLPTLLGNFSDAVVRDIVSDQGKLQFLHRAYVKVGPWQGGLGRYVFDLLYLYPYLMGEKRGQKVNNKPYEVCEKLLTEEEKAQLAGLVQKKVVFSLNIDSLNTLLTGARRVMVYGYEYAHYYDVFEDISHNKKKLREVEPITWSSVASVKEGLRFAESSKPFVNISRTCKTGLTNIFLDNYKKVKQGENPTLILFCVGTNMPTGDLRGKKSPPLPEPETLADRNSPYYSKITQKELRRMYKICCDISEKTSDPELRLLAEVAKKSVKFVTVDYDETLDQFVMHEVPPTWDDPRWGKVWAKRMDSRPSTREVKAATDKWENQLLEAVHRFNAAKKIGIELDRAKVKDLADIFTDLLYETDDNGVAEIKKFKEFLLNNSQVLSRYQERFKMLGFDSISPILNLINDPYFEEMYKMAVAEY